MEDEPREHEASFNMAIATLTRLDEILRRLEIVSEMMNGIPEQKMQIKLARNFMLNASPLMKKPMSDKEIEEYRKKIFSFKIQTKKQRGKIYEVYDSDLSDKIYSVLIDIQMALKEYFMPTKRDMRGL